MKAIVQNMKNGELRVDEVPSPALKPGGILLQVHRSLISLGTERVVLGLAKKSMLGKAQDRPDLARKVIEKARQEGLWNTYQAVLNRLDSPVPLGYSCAGDVLAVGAQAAEFQVGDRVACAGLGFANHAEIDYVPRNLAAKIPSGVSYEDASFVTVGAIAMHGVRLAELELGEKVVVMGLGMVGQVAAQLARRAGASVLASDLDAEKVALAGRLGAHATMSSPADLARQVAEFTEGHGADAVLICAATKSDDPLRQAAEISRLRGRVVIVGDVGMHLERRPFFEKEVRLVVSRSYGPGRYDPEYEVHGKDYPLAYVRWTERRNMASFLELVGRGEVNVGALVTHRFSIEEGERAYQIVSGESKEPAIAIVLEYRQRLAASTRVSLPKAKASPMAAVRLGVIGAGQFARGVLLPAFQARSSVSFHGFCTASGLTSKSVAEHYGAKYCTSDAKEILADTEINAVVIATRHDQHARLAADALRAGKAVFVEKPLAMDAASLADLREAYESADAPRLMVGFNRRFSPLAVRCKEFFSPRLGPLSILYRVNAGAIPAGSWVADPTEGGGRIIGEVCHFVDFAAFLTGAVPVRVYAEALNEKSNAGGEPDAVAVTLRMADSSTVVIHYLGNGDTSVSKEYVEVSGQRRMAILDNFRSLALHSENRARRTRLFSQQKGHREEVAAFLEALHAGKPMPIDFASLVATTQATFRILESLERGVPLAVADGPADQEQAE